MKNSSIEVLTEHLSSFSLQASSHIETTSSLPRLALTGSGDQAKLPKEMIRP